MTSYVLNYADSGATSEIFADDDQTAIDHALDELGDGVVVAGQWDADGQNDDDQPMERLLFWATEEDAQDDAGAKSIAELTVVRG